MSNFFVKLTSTLPITCAASVALVAALMKGCLLYTSDAADE